MRDCHNLRTEHEELLFGQIAQMVVNYSYCRPTEWVAVTDFMPSRRRRPVEYTEPDHDEITKNIRNSRLFKEAKRRAQALKVLEQANFKL